MTKLIGQQLGNYHLLSLLGQGSFADVYLGEHCYLKTQAAIKVLRMHMTSNTLGGFLSSIRIIASLEHPHIVRILEFDVVSGLPFLVMDYAPLGTLRQRHPKGTCLSITSILPYVKQAALALQYVHNKHLIHGDVKPENMLLGQENEVLLSDFGMLLEAVGTPHYLAPERLLGKVCAASDQYALAVVVYEWLCGEPPFRGTLGEIVAQQALVAPPSLYASIPEIPLAIEQVILTALAKDPKQRFTNIQAFADALEQAYQRSLSETETYSSGSATPNPFASPRAPVSSGHSLSRRRALASLSLAGVAIVGGNVAWLSHIQGQNIQPPSTHPLSPLPLGTTIRIYRGHYESVYAVAWQQKSTRIASGGHDGTVQVWDALTGNRLFTRPSSTSPLNATGSPDEISALVWSPDGKYIGIGQIVGATVTVWDVPRRRDTLIFREYLDMGNSVAWSPDGRSIAASVRDNIDKPHVAIWNATTGNRLLSFDYSYSSSKVPLVRTFALAWSPDGKRIAAEMGDNTVVVWNMESQNQLLSYRGHQSVINALAWSPDNRSIVSASSDKTVQVWNATTGDLLFAYSRHTDRVNAVAWSPDSKHIVSASDDKTVQVWRATTGNVHVTYHEHTAAVYAVAWSPDGKYIASGSKDATIRVWQAN